MRKYLLRYLIFWLPGLLVYYFFNNELMLSHVLQWFFAFFMLFGWSVVTGMAAYRHPRKTLSVLLTYTGVHILIMMLLYSAEYGTLRYRILRGYGGILSFFPMNMFVRALRPFNRPSELIVLAVTVGCCLIALLIGVLRRYTSPNPYRPRIRR